MLPTLGISLCLLLPPFPSVLLSLVPHLSDSSWKNVSAFKDSFDKIASPNTPG